MKYIQTYEASRPLLKNYIKVGEILCVDVSKYCKVFTIGKKYDVYGHMHQNPNITFDAYQILNDLGNATNIWSTKTYFDNGIEGEFKTTDPRKIRYSIGKGGATFSFDKTVEDYEVRKSANKYNL